MCVCGGGSAEGQWLKTNFAEWPRGWGKGVESGLGGRTPATLYLPLPGYNFMAMGLAAASEQGEDALQPVWSMCELGV